ncbi:NUDIX hydrolase [Roseofilum sp. BLCC_M154]|uniref:NUDIX hydrolase n=1 Tax=Roseofilum acuticapitatum BLCC-M154 TaxID=3022444 RepID=A0ABT7AWU9_9CYAN|nr:NUDIX hydrolase [Roseofilum acuticapitatum]MDJ1171350.1 NUDIX hydrolase [Roseofilum acuticapitatum BLCC-M154]
MSSPQPWKILHSHLAFDHPWCQVRQDTVQLPNQTIIDDYFVSIRPEVAMIVPVTPDGNILFVRQYRHGVEKVLLELPAGHFHTPEESAAVAARRELEEETGYQSQDWTFLGVLYDNPPKDTNGIHAFLAQNIDRVCEQNLDITEEIELVFIPITEVMNYVVSGDIRVSGTIAALVLALDIKSGFRKRT